MKGIALYITVQDAHQVDAVRFTLVGFAVKSEMGIGCK